MTTTSVVKPTRLLGLIAVLLLSLSPDSFAVSAKVILRNSEAQIQAAGLGLKELPPPERPFDLSFARKANERLKNWKPQ